MRKLCQPSCEQCKRMALHKTGVEGAPRFFCIGKRIAGSPMDPIDMYNFCVYTPWKGVVQFQVWEGDFEIWIALLSVARRLINEDKKLKPSPMNVGEGWLESMYHAFVKEAHLMDEKLQIDRVDSTLSFDPEKRSVRLFMFKCPECGKATSMYGTVGPMFSIPFKFIENGKQVETPFNIWHLDIKDDMHVDISPSIGLHNNPRTGKPCAGHTDRCHLVLTNVPFEWMEYEAITE